MILWEIYFYEMIPIRVSRQMIRHQGEFEVKSAGDYERLRSREYDLTLRIRPGIQSSAKGF